MRMLRTPPFFPPKSGEKPYLVEFSRFGLWRDFLNDNREVKHGVYGRRQTAKITSDFLFFSCNPQINHTKIEVSLIIHSKYKYFDSTVQRAEERQQKFHFCRLPFAVNVLLNLSNIQETISVFRLIKNMSINPKSVEFHLYHAKPHSICFFIYHNIKDNERNLCQDLLTIENTDSNLKVHALHYANELLARVRLSIQKLFAKSLNIQKQYENNVWQKSNDAYSWSIRVQTTMNHISIFTFLCFYDNINVKENVFFQSAS